jgi:hypothetical protein
MFRTYGSFCCAVVLTATSALADPPSPGQGTIQLHHRTVDGDEFVPNDETAVKPAQGETKQFAEPDPEKARADLHPPSVEVGASAGVTVTMIVDNPRVGLFRMIDHFYAIRVPSGRGFWTEGLVFQESSLACAAPCNKTVDPQFLYHVAGEGITRSASFRFPPGRSAYKLEVDSGSSWSDAAGFILTSAGICLAALGGTFLAVGAVDRDRPAFLPVAGAVGAGAGVISMAVGIPLWISGQTSVRVDAGMNEPKSPRPAAMARFGTIWLRSEESLEKTPK